MQRWVAIISTVLLIVKFGAYYITRSVSILTDALESIVNVAAGFIGLYSLYVAAKPRDIDHPYGHGKAEFISAAVEGTLIFSAGLLVIYNSVERLLNARLVKDLNTGIILISATALVNWLVGFYALRIGRRNGSVALQASGRHLQTDTYSTLAIIVGLIIITITGLTWIDSVIAILFGCYIIYTGYRIIRESLAGIMDEADLNLLQKMVDVLNKNRRENWVDLHNLRVIKYGNVLHVDCHLTVPYYLNVDEAHLEIDELASLIRKNFGESMELFVHSDGCRFFQCHLCYKHDCPVRKHPFESRLPWTLHNALQNEKHGSHEAMKIDKSSES